MTEWRVDELIRGALLVTVWVIAMAAVSTIAHAQSVERDPDLPPLPQKVDKRLRVTKQSLHLGSAATIFTDTVSASQFRIPLGDGTYSSWAVAGFPQGGSTGLDYLLFWGFNYPVVDPTKNILGLIIETNYQPTVNDAHYTETYLQYVAPDGTALRPWQIDIPVHRA